MTKAILSIVLPTLFPEDAPFINENNSKDIATSRTGKIFVICEAETPQSPSLPAKSMLKKKDYLLMVQYDELGFVSHVTLLDARKLVRGVDKKGSTVWESQ